MVAKKSCSIDGIEYESLSAAAEALGIGLSSLKSRLRSSNYPEYISERHPKRKTKPKAQPCRIDGIDYASETAAAKVLGIRLPTLRIRLQSPSFPGYVSQYHAKKNYRKIIRVSVDGVEYSRISGAARELGIPRAVLISRLASVDYPGYVCANIPKKPPPSPRYKVKGRLYMTLQEIGDVEGITKERVRQKMGSLSHPDYVRIGIPKKASKLPKQAARRKHRKIRTKEHSCVVDGVEYGSEQAAAIALGTRTGVVRYRLRSSNFPEYISQYHPKVAKKSQDLPCTVKGVEYKSQKAAAKALGIGQGSLRSRLCSPNYPDHISKHHPKMDVVRKERPCRINGVAYDSEGAAVEALGIDAGVLRDRLRSVSFPEYTSEHYRKVRLRRGKYPCRINGIEYESESVAAEALGMTTGTLRNRLLSPLYPQYISKRRPKRKAKPRGYPCNIGGTEYKSEMAATRALGISESSLRSRLRSPNFPEYNSQHHPKVADRSRKHPCIVGGVEYVSETESARVLGIGLSALRRRLRSPNHPDHTSRHRSKFPSEPKGHPCVVDGVEYESETAAADALGTSPSTMRYRLRSSAFPEYISQYHPKVAKKSQDLPCTVKGVEYESQKAAAKALGIGQSSLQARLCSPNYPDHVSRHHPKTEAKTRGQPCTVNGVRYKSKIAAAKALGISEGSLQARLCSSRFPEYISQYHQKIDVERKERPCRINGVEYDSEGTAAEALGMDAGALRDRLRSVSFPEYTSEYHRKVRVRTGKYPCQIDGIEYESQLVASKALGILAGTLRNRLLSPHYPQYISKHHPKREAKPRGYPCVVEGIEYESEQAAGNALGIHSTLVAHRLRSPNFPEYISKRLPKRPPKVAIRPFEQPCTVGGIEYKSETAATKALGISKSSLRSRLRSPNFPEYTSRYHAKVADRSRKHPCIVDEVEYKSEIAAAKDLGIEIAVLHDRLRSSSHPGYISKYHTKEVRKKPLVPCSVDGAEYASITDASKTLGISVALIRSRLASPDFPEYVCADIPKKPKPQEPSKPRFLRYKARGKFYATLQEIADAEGITEEQARQRMNDPSCMEYQPLWKSRR